MSEMTSPKKPRIPVGSRVRLRDGVDPGFYEGLGRSGNEGWIRKRRQDDYGYSHVMIEWDQDHWSYNGAPNGWTWEDHFESIEENMAEGKQPNNKEDLEKIMKGATEDFIKTVFKVAGLNDEQVKTVDESVEEGNDLSQADEKETEEDKWKQTVGAATLAASNSKAFLLIALHMKPEEGDNPAIVVPVVIQNSRDKEFTLVLQSQLAHLSTALYDGLIGQSMHATEENESD